MSALPELDSPEVQNVAKEDTNCLNAYNVCLQYERNLPLLRASYAMSESSASCCSMHPIRVLAPKSQSAYSRVRIAASLSILVHFWNVTSSYLCTVNEGDVLITRVLYMGLG